MSTSELALQQVLLDHPHLDLTPDVVKTDSTQVGGGGYSDVFRSKMQRGWQPRKDVSIENLLDLGRIEYPSKGPEKRHKADWKPPFTVVAVKRLRFWDKPISKVEKAIAKEITIWARLSHPNVLPILGYVLNWTGSTYPSLVSPWMENGTLRVYMNRNRREVDIRVMIVGIVSGLQYLHSQQVVHADLKCDNVLLSTSLQPLLTDFGLSRQIIASVSTSTTASGGTLRWKAPELIRGGWKANKQSDIWALGMTLLELLTHDVPYCGLNDGQVVQSLFNGTKPVCPYNLDQHPLLHRHLWTLCQDCWIINPSMRPTAIEIASRLNLKILPESITQFTQLLDIFPHLNLTDVVGRSDFPSSIPIPLSHFDYPAHRKRRLNFHFQDVCDEFTPERVSEKTSEVQIQVSLSSAWARLSQISRKPSVIAKVIATLDELFHQNILPFLGYLHGPNQNLLFVFPSGENLNDYMHRKVVDILPMVEGIASGLSYLHSKDVVCSILRSFDVKLSPASQPLIQVSECWLSQPDTGIPQDEYQLIFRIHCNWIAVEIFDDRLIGITTKETDVWAFGMTVLELFTKQDPYGSPTSSRVIIDYLKHHQLPPPPDDIAYLSEAEQSLWHLVQECWNFEPSERPTAQHLFERIQGIMRGSDSSLVTDINSDSEAELTLSATSSVPSLDHASDSGV